MVADAFCCAGRQGQADLVHSCTGAPVLTARLMAPERLMNAFAARVSNHTAQRGVA